MRIAIIGTGTIGSTLAAAFAAANHDVIYGTREPSAAPPPAAGLPVASIPSAVKGADVVVLAVPGASVPDLRAPLRTVLDGVLVIDATNRMDSGPANSQEAIAGVPGARYARAFNSIGVETLRAPSIDGAPVDMLYACACARADRAVVASLIGAAGPRPVWTGEDNWGVCDASLKLWLGLARTFGRHLGLRVLSDTLTEE